MVATEHLPHTRTIHIEVPSEPDDTMKDVEFRLIYEGPLPAETSAPRVQYKHQIRQQLHPQIRELFSQDDDFKAHGAYLADQYERCGFRFVPVVHAASPFGFDTCSIELLFLRRDVPGGVIKHGGDIDNRIKVFFDGLKMVKHKDELGGATPAPDEDPFFCLLEDDSLITEVKITTDRLLKPLAPAVHEHDVVIICSVKTRTRSWRGE